MDGVLQFGPLMIATDRIIALALLLAFVRAGAVIGARTKSPAERAAWIAAGTGIVAARVGYILENAPAFAIEPWSALAIWQGGFSLWPGVLAAAGVIGAVLIRRRLAMSALLVTLAVLTSVQLGAAALLAPPVRPMPDNVTFTELDGRTTRLEDLRGRPFVINLWASWCPPCRREMPMFIDVAASSSVPIFLVNQGESEAQVAAFLKREGLSAAAIGLDPRGTLSQVTGSRVMPMTLFINAEGNIARTHAGEISRAALHAGLRDLAGASS